MRHFNTQTDQAARCVALSWVEQVKKVILAVVSPAGGLRALICYFSITILHHTNTNTTSSPPREKKKKERKEEKKKKKQRRGEAYLGWRKGAPTFLSYQPSLCPHSCPSLLNRGRPLAFCPPALLSGGLRFKKNDQKDVITNLGCFFATGVWPIPPSKG